MHLTPPPINIPPPPQDYYDIFDIIEYFFGFVYFCAHQCMGMFRCEIILPTRGALGPHFTEISPHELSTCFQLIHKQ